MAQRNVLEVTIAAAGSHGDASGHLEFVTFVTPRVAKCRSSTQSHAGAWSGWVDEVADAVIEAGM
jgi:hypothetical protein